MKKIIYLLWKPKGQTPAETRDILLNECAPKLLEKNLSKLTMNIDDPDSANVKSGAPFHPGEPICATVSLWLEENEIVSPYEIILRRPGFRLAGFLVDESVYTEYGGNKHSSPRDWPDGVRSPGLMAVTLMERPKRLSREEWIRRWHGTQSPVSESMQPRQRYIRNIIIKPVTSGAPPFEGIVEEIWPSEKHIRNLFLFYCSNNIFQLIRNMTIMLWSVTRFLNLFKIRSTIMSEYLLKT